MQASERVEQALEARRRTRPRDPARRLLLAGALRYAVFPGGHRIRPQLVLAVARACGDRDPARCRRRGRGDRAAALRFAGPRRPPCVRQRRPPARQAVRPCRLRRAHRGADRRRADRAGVRDRSPAPSAHKPRQLGAACTASSPARSARRAASSPDRPGSPRRPCRWSTTSAPRPARCSSARRWPAPPPPGRIPSPWRRARRGDRRSLPGRRRSARRAVRRRGTRQADRPGRSAACAPTPPRSSASAAPRRGSARWSTRPRRRSRLPRRRGIAHADPRADPGVLPQATRARRGLTMSAVAGPRRTGSRSANGCGTGGAGLSPSPLSALGGLVPAHAAPSPQNNARALFDLCAGFVYSQILAACVRLDVFARLADGPRSAARSLASDMSLTPEAARAAAARRRRR